jgi:hypothetical protein
MSTDAPSDDDTPPGDGSRDWPYLDDLVAGAWLLGLIALAFSAAVYLALTGRLDLTVDLALTGTIDIGWVFWLLTILALMEVYGAKRVRSLLDNWRPARDDEE